jgi:hypothetical protein
LVLNIRQSPPEALIPTTLAEIYQQIRSSVNELSRETTRLRRIAQVDKKVYTSMKVKLPYFIAATFKEDCRHSDNFVEISALTIDFDDCLKTPIQSKDLKQKIAEQPDVVLAFTSPNGRGIKVVCLLEEPIDDIQLFKAYYLDFARNFAERLSILGTLDTRTSDVTRICFLAHDTTAYFNASAVKLNWRLWVQNQTFVPPQEPTTEQITGLLIESKPELNEDIHRQLRLKINPRAPVRQKIPPHVPVLLQTISNDARLLLENNGITVSEIVPIHYGLKFSCIVATALAEVNVFYGKKGFSVVKSAKTAVDDKLNDQVYQLIFNFLFYSNNDAP